MTNFEMVEVLRDKACVSYEDAKAALEAAGWDLLDAMLLLEQQGRVPLQSCSYSTREEAQPEEEQPRGHRGPNGLRSAIRHLGKVMRNLIRIGNSNYMVVSRNDEEIFSLPVTVCAILLVCSVWTVLVVMLISMCFGVRYTLRGPNLGKDSINSAMNRVADAAENFKEEINRPDGEKQ